MSGLHQSSAPASAQSRPLLPESSPQENSCTHLSLLPGALTYFAHLSFFHPFVLFYSHLLSTTGMANAWAREDFCTPSQSSACGLEDSFLIFYAARKQKQASHPHHWDSWEKWAVSGQNPPGNPAGMR